MANSFLDQVSDPNAPPPVRPAVKRETTFRPHATAEGEGGPLRIGAVLREAGRLYARRFPSLWLMALVVYMPVVAWYALNSKVAGSMAIPSFLWLFNGLGQNGWQWMLLDGVYLCFASVWCLSALRDDDTSLRDKLMKGLKYLLPTVGMLILYNVLLTIGLIILLVPGLVIATFAAVLIPALVAGDKNKFGERVYSWHLVSGYGWPVFGILTILYVFDMVTVMGTGALTSFIWSPMVANLHGFLTTTITTSVQVVVSCVLYAHLHRKKFGAQKGEIESIFA